MPTILYETEVRADVDKLDSAWHESETFALVPDKLGETAKVIDASLATLPSRYHVGHYALLTSGSTGQPKLLFGCRKRSETLVSLLHEHQSSEAARETIVLLPFSYCYSFVNQYLWARSYNRRLVLTRGLTKPEELKSALASAKDAMLCLVGAQVPLLLEYFAGSRFSGVIRVHFAGGRFPAQRFAELQELFPNALIFNNYGCAEAMPRLTLRSAEDSTDSNHVGWPLPGIEIRTSRDGDLLFRSPYGAVAQADAQGFRQIESGDWVPTGDLGQVMTDGHVELFGRASQVFKRYGEKISIPGILDSIFSTWQGQASAYREFDASGEEGYVLVVAPHPTAIETRKVLSSLRTTHARPHWPLRLESLDELPILPNGKVDAEGLRARTDLRQHWRQRI